MTLIKSGKYLIMVIETIIKNVDLFLHQYCYPCLSNTTSWLNSAVILFKLCNHLVQISSLLRSLNIMKINLIGSTTFWIHKWHVAWPKNKTFFTSYKLVKDPNRLFWRNFFILLELMLYVNLLWGSPSSNSSFLVCSIFSYSWIL